MGEVWKCTDLVLERFVALKTVSLSYLQENPKAISILKDEAKTGAKLLGHPNIVSVLDFGQFQQNDTTVYFLVMEFIDGMSVAKWIGQMQQQVDEITCYNINLLIAWELCKAVSFAHRAGILHRDIKPLNIFLSNFGITKVGDFGLSRFVEMATRTHTVLGMLSPAYSAPEQWKGEKHTEETDIYQLGCTLYHIFTGKLPFEYSGIAMMNAHLNLSPTPPHEVVNTIPKDLSDVIVKTLNKQSKKRVDLWEINDTIASQIQKKYTLKVFVHDKPKSIHKLVREITDFDEEKLGKEPFSFVFPDFSEVLSEGMELLLAGISSFEIRAIEEISNIEEKSVS